MTIRHNVIQIAIDPNFLNLFTHKKKLIKIVIDVTINEQALSRVYVSGSIPIT